MSRYRRRQGRSGIESGQLRRNRLIRTVATYRVVSLQGPRVLVEVVDAPGLTPGERFVFSAASVEAMDVVPSPDD